MPMWSALTVERTKALARRETPQLGDADLDHEAAAGLEMRGGVRGSTRPAASGVVRLLIVLKTRYARRNVPSTRVVATRRSSTLDLVAARLRAAACATIGLGQVDPGHADAALRERQRDPAGADPELERGAVAGELGQEVDGRLDARPGQDSSPLAAVVAGRHLVRRSSARAPRALSSEVALAGSGGSEVQAVRPVISDGSAGGAHASLETALQATPQAPPYNPTRMIYCVIPRELEDELYDKMVEYYKDNPNVTVIVDRREGADRRTGQATTAASADDPRPPPRARSGHVPGHRLRPRDA